jgi:hypothetical protein
MVARSKMPPVIQPDPPPPAPERGVGETAELAEKQRQQFFRRGGGRANTFLTGGSGGGPSSTALRFLGAGS